MSSSGSKPTGWDGDCKTWEFCRRWQKGSKPTGWDGD